MDLFRRWLGGSPRPDGGKGKDRRTAILERLDEIGPDTPEAAALYNRLADLELQEGSEGLALRYYGRSIDLHVELRQFDAATAICRKLLRLLPGVVRARCTLAWLSLRKGHLDVARAQVDEYVKASIEAGTGELAAQQLRLMAQYTSSPELRAHLAKKLRAVGDEEGAKEAEKGGTGFVGGGGGSWDPVVFATLLTPDELKEAEAKGLEIPTRGRGDDSLPTFSEE